jgi:hypothetical protein
MTEKPASEISTYDVMKWVGGIAAAAVIGVLGFLAGEVSDLGTKTETVDSGLQNFRVEVARDYVSKAQLDKLEDRITQQLERIIDSLDELKKGG